MRWASNSADRAMVLRSLFLVPAVDFPFDIETSMDTGVEWGNMKEK